MTAAWTVGMRGVLSVGREGMDEKGYGHGCTSDDSDG
jgi:hypothetical protein